VLAATALTLALAADASAQTILGTTIGAPTTWNRPSQGNPPTSLSSTAGTNVGFNVFGFNASAAGSYTITTTGFDTFLCLSQNAFSAATPLSNVLACNDDFEIGGGSRLTRDLNTGVDYFAVVTGYGNTSVGAYTMTFEGAGTVSAIGSTPDPEPPPPVAVPEPQALALLAAGLLGLGAGRRRRATFARGA
jgi:MYXO-CTERM domain-containing protein